MNRIKREDGTVLTDKEMEELHKDIENIGKPIGEYFKITELEGVYLPSLIGHLLIENVKRKENEVIFDLKIGDDILLEKEVVYPISKQFDKKEKISTSRLMSLLQWLELKYIDKIMDFYGD